MRGMIGNPGGGGERSAAEDKAPLTWRETLGIGVSGFIGSMIAILADLTQNGEASALRTIRDGLDQYLALSASTEWALPTVPAVVMLLLLFIGVALCFIFEVRSKRAGLYVGACIISLIVTLVPYQPANPLGASGSGGASSEGRGPGVGALVKVLQPSVNHVVLEIRADTLPDDATVELRNADTREIVGRTTYELTRGLEGRSRIEFDQRPGRYLLTVQAPGYSSYQCAFELSMDVTFEVALQGSGFLGPVRDFLTTRSEPCQPLEDGG